MKIAVASCTKLQQTNPQQVWSEIQNERPDVLLLTGDNIYLDHDNHKDPAKLREELQRLYAAQLAEQILPRCSPTYAHVAEICWPFTMTMISWGTIATGAITIQRCVKWHGMSSFARSLQFKPAPTFTHISNRT